MEDYEKICPECSVNFETPREFQQFCSLTCQQDDYRRHAKAKPKYKPRIMAKAKKDKKIWIKALAELEPPER